MIAEILATGDELRTGALVDSNSAHIAEALLHNGVDVARHLTVGDDMDMLVTVIGEIAARADLAVVTGGLGPTQDDLTAEALARAAGVPLVEDARALADIELFFSRRNRPLSPSNRKQALLPQGADILYNPVGTAPGFRLRLGRCFFYCLPGVPFEMSRMLAEQVLPHVRELQGPARFYLIRTLACFGLPESVVGEKLAALNNHFQTIKLGLRAKFPEIQVKLYLDCDDRPQGEALLESAAAWVAERLGANLFSRQGDSMSATIGRLLKEAGATLALAESCTGGLIANWLTDTSGSSDYFLFAAVTYADAAKQAILGVPAQTLAQHGAVHERTAEAMAQGVRRVAGSTYGLATTGIAGPGGGSEQKPVGTVCIALAGPGGFSYSRRFHFTYGGRLMNKQLFAMSALDMLRRKLRGEPLS
jgi:nicotinamide-nucleotide amidase